MVEISEKSHKANDDGRWFFDVSGAEWWLSSVVVDSWRACVRVR